MILRIRSIHERRAEELGINRAREHKVKGYCKARQIDVEIYQIEYPPLPRNPADDSCNNSIDCDHKECNLHPGGPNFKPRKGTNYLR